MNSNEPLSYQWHQVAQRWVEAESAADLLENTKSAVLSQMMSRRPEASVAAKELAVKASVEWEDYVTRIAKARKEANLLKVEKEFMTLRFWEANSQAATERALAKL